MKQRVPENSLREGDTRDSRRGALKSIIGLLGGYAIAQSSMVAAMPAEPRPAFDVDALSVQYPSGDATIEGYFAKPKSEGQHPAVIVIHSLSGLDNHIQDLTRRFAAEGFVALAPNLASRDGRSNISLGGTAIAHLDPRLTVQDVKLGYEFLSRDDSGVDPERISVVGLGWGGWRAFMLAEAMPKLYRAVVYYGSTPEEGLESMKTPILAHYAGNDFRVTGNALWTEKAMKQFGKAFTYIMYDGADAEFMSKLDKPRNAEAAQLSWEKTLEFLRSPS